MSRYYQSSYHGSNDYRKYRQERLKANDAKPQTYLKSSFQQKSIYKPSSNLQTFRRQDKIASYDTHAQIGKTKDINLKSRYQNYGIQQTNHYDHILNKYEPRQREYTLKSNNYLQDRQDKIYPCYNQVTDPKNHQNSHQISRFRSSSRYSKYQDTPQTFSLDNFEDSVISRRIDYGYQNIERKNEADQSLKNYNYSAKVKSLSQRDQFSEVNKDKFNLLKRQIQQDKKLGQRNYLNSTYNLQTQKKSSYQSRNEMIRQRLNVNPNSQSINSVIPKPNYKQESRQEYDANVKGYSSRFISTHATPQKSHLTPKDDKNLSQQRRKSLIQKSQMLKQKLNKLNSSTNKLIQQDQQENTKRQNNAEKQNIASQKYTPSKKYLSMSFNQNQENQKLTEHSISKKLDFDLNKRGAQTQRNYDTTLKESNGNISRNQMKAKNNKDFQKFTLKDANLSAKKNYSNQESGDGALKKIQQLNQRINSRLQSILKNYG